MPIQRIGILTGGGDCSGLNAVIRALTLSAIRNHNLSVIGIEKGFEGLVFNHSQELTLRSVRDILPQGGTILGTSNKGDPFAFKELHKDGSITTHDYSSRAVKTFRDLKLDCLFVIGGDGSLQIAYKLSELGLPVIAVPKTIDNDLEGTDYSFGFHTAVQVATDAIDRLQTTGRSHDRVMILEVMGRSAGWIALESGIAGGAHVILVPEIPFDFNLVTAKIRERQAMQAPFSLVVVAEGAMERDCRPITQEAATTRLQGVPQLGGIGNHLAGRLGRDIDLEVRCTVLGHIQRGGTPIAFDRVLGTQLGSFALHSALKGRFGTMVALRTPDLNLVPLKDLAGRTRQVPLDSQLIRTAESVGICLGR
ncbi:MULTISPECIES: 6-phosphofructokinase [unclassified Nitrospina]|uniref:6-phosphofructokinase n=1 Tax=unclassified Nitrospina TaxID=2638683 RepID=UPI003F944216